MKPILLPHCLYCKLVFIWIGKKWYGYKWTYIFINPTLQSNFRDLQRSLFNNNIKWNKKKCMEALNNYSLVGCTCININTKMEDKTVMA
jgi:hypothetical protein